MKSAALFTKYLMLLFTAGMVQVLQAQTLQRKTTQENTDEFTLQYSFHSDSLKGFFILTEEITGKTKLVKATCTFPYRFENGRLQVSGEKMIPGLSVNFTFKMLDKNVRLIGRFRSENFGNPAYEKIFPEIKLEKREPLLAMDQQNPSMAEREQKPGEMYSTINTKSIEPVNDQTVKSSNDQTTSINKAQLHGPPLNDTGRNQQSTINNQAPSINNQQPTINDPGISFRIQLAASSTPMDKEKIKRLTGLDLPVNEDHVDGLYKYTIGNEKTLAEAQAILNRIATGHFKKPFIVAYRQQTRISVQQALAEINKTN